MSTPFDFWLAYWSALAPEATETPVTAPASTGLEYRSGVVLDYRDYRMPLRKWARHG